MANNWLEKRLSRVLKRESFLITLLMAILALPHGAVVLARTSSSLQGRYLNMPSYQTQQTKENHYIRATPGSTLTIQRHDYHLLPADPLTTNHLTPHQQVFRVPTGETIHLQGGGEGSIDRHSESKQFSIPPVRIHMGR